MDEYWNGDEHLCNLCQQIAGSFNYAAQLRPELMFSVSQLSRVMSCPTKKKSVPHPTGHQVHHRIAEFENHLSP